MIPATILTFPFFLFFPILFHLSCNCLLIQCPLRTVSIWMVLGLAVSAQPNVVFYGYILTIICMFVGSGSTRSTLPWYHRWISYIRAIYVEGMRSPATVTLIVFLWVFFSSFPFEGNRARMLSFAK